MLARRILAVAVAGLLAVSCSGADTEPAVDPTVAAQRRQYTQLESIRSTFIDSAATGIEHPDGYDAAGVELWDHYRDTQAAIDDLESDVGDDATVDVWVEATKALFVHAYGSGLAADMIASEIEQRPATVVESSVVPFDDGRPVTVVELDQTLRQDGCDAIEGEYNVWVGQTNIDEIAGRASIFARYALDQAATAGCDWAIIELTQQTLRISGLHADSDATDDEQSATATTTDTTIAAATTTTPAPAPTQPDPAITTLPTTATTLDEWDQYYPIEYAPGFRLRIKEPTPCEATLRPAIVSVNTYTSGDFVGRGFVVVEIRADGPTLLTFDAQFLQEIADVAARAGMAVQWLRANADTLCVAPEAIAVTGYSYGALAAFALAYSDTETEAGTLVVVDELGPPQVSETQTIEPPPELAGFSNDPNAVVAHAGFALAETIEVGEPPSLLFNGTNDPLIPFTLAEQTCAAAQAVGIVCEIRAHDDGHHFAANDQEALDIATEFLEREMVTPADLELRPPTRS